MRVLRAGDDAKGWLAGPWDGSSPIGIGYANEALDDPHLHTQVTEVFLVAAGAVVVNVEGAEIDVVVGEVLILEPGEAHTFVSATEDYRAFVVHAGWDGGSDKVPVDPSRLGLN